MADFDRLFSQFRDTPWRTDPNGVPQEGLPGNGNPESTGWLSDGAVTADVIQANAVIAGKIDADAVTAREIAANTITASEIAANTITASEIAANTITATEIAANTITAAQIAANTITATEIAADAITTTELAANAVITENLLAANVTSSKIALTISGKNFGANAGSAAAPGVYFDAASTTGMYLASGDIGFSIGGSVGFVIGEAGNNQSQWALTPRQDNVVSSGASGKRWTAVWAANGTIQTSDEREKQDIADEPLGLDFVRSLRPRVFRWRDTPDTQAQEAVSVDEEALARDYRPHVETIEQIRAKQLAGELGDDDAEKQVAKARAKLAAIKKRHLRPVVEAQQRRRPGKRLHHGLIAQEVKAALDSVGVDSMDAAFWQQDPEGRQSLSYSELIAPLIKAVQELDAKVTELAASQ